MESPKDASAAGLRESMSCACARKPTGSTTAAAVNNAQAKL